MLELNDKSQTVFFEDAIDAVRAADEKHRLYIMSGNTSHVLLYNYPDQREDDFRTVWKTLEHPFEVGDLERSVVSLEMLVGFRNGLNNEPSLLLIFQSWTLICHFSDVGARDARRLALMEELDSLGG